MAMAGTITAIVRTTIIATHIGTEAVITGTNRLSCLTYGRCKERQIVAALRFAEQQHTQFSRMIVAP